jgi:hypothetical protein
MPQVVAFDRLGEAELEARLASDMDRIASAIEELSSQPTRSS